MDDLVVNCVITLFAWINGQMEGNHTATFLHIKVMFIRFLK